MIISSLIITQFTGGTSANESSVRELLLASPVFMLINISILAPITEELIFRKSIQPLIKNKWVRAIISGILFGGAHLLTGDAIRLVDLLFLLPYGTLGFVFSLMDNDRTGLMEAVILKNDYDIIPIIIPKELGVKDFAELRSSYSTNVINELTQQVVKYIEDNYGEETEFTWDTEESNTLPY